MESAKEVDSRHERLLPLPVGNSDWVELRREYWSADKTQLISGLLERRTTVALFTRPRRFGKTTAMRMIRAFFEKTEGGGAHLFENTKVWSIPECRAEQGKYPVIFISLKDAKGSDWNRMRTFMRQAIASEFLRHADVFSADDCIPEWKAASDAMRMGTADEETMTGALSVLAQAIHSHHGEKPVILIDEYDSPINYAATHGFGEEAMQFFRNFLSGALKDGKHCRMGILTGILRVAKEGVLSGLNNLKVYSVFDEAFSDCFGFTEEEVRGLLAYYGHPEKIDEAKDWYDGYSFGGRDMYNPWSLINYVQDGFKPRPYWTSTSSNDVVTDLISQMTPGMRGVLADFFEKGERVVACPTELGPYGTVQNDPRRIWPLLVHTGYLKALSAPDESGMARLSFPNRELVRVFREDILAPLNRAPVVGDDLQSILECLATGDAEGFRKGVEAFLVSSASYFDTAREDFFHGLLLGLLALGRDSFEIKSNRESGDGRPDISMKPRPGKPFPGVILELKSPRVSPDASAEQIEAALAASAKEARSQIDERRYAAEMEAAGIAVLKYGVGFLGKRVSLAK